jgi:hypothetical protein
MPYNSFSFFAKCILTGLIIFLLGIHNGCTSTPEFPPSPKQGSPEELIEREKIFLDYYGTTEDRENAFLLLKHRCESNSEDAHSCYNYAVLRLYVDDKEEALKYIRIANERKPGDPLYESMHRNLVVWKKNSYEIKSSLIKKDFTDIEIGCKFKEDISSKLEPLVREGHIRKPMLLNGSLRNCINFEQQKSLTTEAKLNPINYSEEFYKEKSKSDPFSDIWDTDYLLRKKNIEDSPNMQKKLSLIWRNFRIAVKSSQKEKARGLLKEFLTDLETGNYDKNKAKSIERAAFFLIEQDAFFKNQRELLKEFGDKAPR